MIKKILISSTDRKKKEIYLKNIHKKMLKNEFKRN